MFPREVGDGQCCHRCHVPPVRAPTGGSSLGGILGAVTGWDGGSGPACAEGVLSSPRGFLNQRTTTEGLAGLCWVTPTVSLVLSGRAGTRDTVVRLLRATAGPGAEVALTCVSISCC